MITCPNCNNSLPDWATTCQFCHTDVRSLAKRPSPDDVRRSRGKLPEKTIWGLYYALATLWIINGAVTAFDSLRTQKIDGEMVGPGIFSYIFAGIGFLTILVGIGLILKVELARGIVNFLAGLNILFGLIGLLASLAAMTVAGPFAFLFVLNNIIQIIVAGASIWIIGETQSRAPNI